MRPGKFISFEGGEGAGKSTQARLLHAALTQREYDAVLTREPGGTAGAESIRGLLLANEGEGWHPRAEALLFAAARSDHVERLIRPALADARWVVCDRFLDSSRAYQGGGGGLDDADLQTLHTIGSAGLLPDLTILVTVSPQEAQRRLALRDGDRGDRIGSRPLAYHARVAAAFAQMAEREPQRFAIVDGNGGTDATHALVLDALAGLW
jgi:dTMP kinase